MCGRGMCDPESWFGGFTPCRSRANRARQPVSATVGRPAPGHTRARGARWIRRAASGLPTEPAGPPPASHVTPPPLSRSSITRDEISDVTPESQRFCTELFDQLHSQGRYTPCGTKPTLVFPGTLGGAAWSGVSFDPALGYIFVNTNEAGAVGWMAEQPKDSPVRYKRTSSAGEYARFWDAKLWPCQKPPWGLLRAIDATTA